MRRRRPKVERVRHELRQMPPELMLNAYAEEIVRLRGAMQQVLDLLDGDLIRDLSMGRSVLRAALEREGWWR